MKLRQTKEGWWIIDGDSHVSKWIEETGRLDHAPWLAELAAAHVPEGGIIIDGGALYGDHTITYSRKVGARGRVMAIEPGDLAFECLTRNVAQFEHKNVVCIHEALSNKPGELVSFEQNENLGASRCKSFIEGLGVTTTIDSMMPAFLRLDFIKLDIEGWEVKALKGAEQTILRFKPSMLIEMNFSALAQQQTSYGEIFDLMKQWGYDWSVAQPDCKPTDPQWDLLATSK